MADQRKEEEGIHYWGDIPEQEYYALQGISGSSSYFTSPRGLTLFTRRWLPSGPARGLVFMVHGYGNDISWTFQATPIFLARHGFACFALDLEAHGRSAGLRAFVPSVDRLVEDCLAFFTSVKASPEFRTGPETPAFLFGESMGGAICLMIQFADPQGFDGAVLVAPMCRIADAVRPPWPVPQVLTQVARLFPTLAIVPTEDIMRKSVKVQEKIAIADRNPMRYRGKPRLGTVVELLRVTECLSGKLAEVTIPFLVVHGSADAVTDPDVSRTLHEAARSSDKSLRIYEGMMHSLLFGETNENVETVRADILAWLSARCRVPDA